MQQYDMWNITWLGATIPMLFCKDFKNIVLTFTPIGVIPNTTISLYTSNSENRPNLALPASASNVYSFAIDRQDWDIGVGQTQWKNGDQSIHILIPYQNVCTWVWCKTTAGGSGTIRVTATMSNNE